MHMQARARCLRVRACVRVIVPDEMRLCERGRGGAGGRWGGGRCAAHDHTRHTIRIGGTFACNHMR